MVYQDEKLNEMNIILSAVLDKLSTLYIERQEAKDKALAQDLRTQ